MDNLKNVLEQFTNYIENTVKPTDQAFGMLWQIQGYLEAQKEDKPNLDDQMKNAKELFEKGLKDAKSLMSVFDPSMVINTEFALDFVLKLAIAMVSYVKNANSLRVLSSNLPGSKQSPPIPFPIPTIKRIPEQDSDVITDADLPINIGMLVAGINKLIMLSLNPTDRVFVYGNENELVELTENHVKVIWYQTNPISNRYEKIDMDTETSLSGIALLIG